MLKELAVSGKGENFDTTGTQRLLPLRAQLARIETKALILFYEGRKMARSEQTQHRGQPERSHLAE